MWLDFLIASFYDIRRLLCQLSEGFFTCVSQLRISDPSLLGETSQESKAPVFSAPAAPVEPSAESMDK